MTTLWSLTVNGIDIKSACSRFSVPHEINTVVTTAMLSFQKNKVDALMSYPTITANQPVVITMRTDGGVTYVLFSGAVESVGIAANIYNITAITNAALVDFSETRTWRLIYLVNG